MDIIFEIQNKMAQLDVALKSLRKTGSEFAQAEKDYKEAVSKKVLELKAEGMAATLIQLVIYGMPDISTMRFKRDIAETIYKANQESINIIKLELRILQAQYEREFANEITE